MSMGAVGLITWVIAVSTLSDTSHVWHWPPVALGVLFVAGFVFWVIGLSRRPRRLSRLVAEIGPVRLQTQSVMTDSQYAHSMAIEVTARKRPLANCVATLTDIERTPASSSPPPTPVRLFWQPALAATTTIHSGASSRFEVALDDVAFSPMVRSPDTALPHSLEQGSWTARIELTADGFAAEHLVASFEVATPDIIWQDVRRREHLRTLRAFLFLHGGPLRKLWPGLMSS